MGVLTTTQKAAYDAGVTKLAGISTGADVTLTALAAASTDIAINSKKITGHANGVLDTDGVNFGQVNDLSGKKSCTASTTGALAGTWTYANGTAGVGAALTRTTNGALEAQDGITLGAGLTLFVRHQAASETCGRYDVTQFGDASNPVILTRSTDADLAAKLRGSVIAVAKGTLYSGTIWVLPLKSSEITVGTTALTWINSARSTVDAAIVVVAASTTTALPSYTTSGGPGAGFTLTASSNGALASTFTDGTTLSTGELLLVEHGAVPIDNDVYVVTQGTGGTPWSMVRYTGLDSAAKIAGSMVRVQRGRRRGGGLYLYSSRAAITMGTTKLYRKRIDDGASCNERAHWRADLGQLAAVANLQVVAGTDGAIHILQTSSGALGVANSATTVGEVSYTLGASATAVAGIQEAWTAAVTQPDGGGAFIASNEVGFRVATRITIPTLSTVAQEFSVQFGLCKTRNNQQKGSSDGTLWVYDRLTNVNWRAVTSLASVTTGTDTDSGVAADSNYRELAIEKDPGDDSLYLLLDDVLVSTHSTNLPNAQLLGLLCMAFKSAGATTMGAPGLKIDWIEKDVWWPKGRA